MPAAKSPAPRLCAGVHPVRRDPHHLQLGLDAPHRLVLRDDDLVHAGLAALTDGEPPPDPSLANALEAAGLVAAPPDPREIRCSVVLESHGLDPRDVRSLLTDAGIPCGGTGGDDGADGLTVLMSNAPLRREVVDELVASGRTHLLVEGTGAPGTLRVGPFVVPGRTACLRCIDAQAPGADPRRGLVLAQLAELPGVRVAATDLALVVAWVARDVLAWADGRRPATWSATVDVGPVALPVLRERQRHPDCGCAWDELVW